MPFISPMLADMMPGSDSKDPAKRWSSYKIESGKWAVEEKYDGHRLVIEVADGVTLPTSLFDERAHPKKVVRNWSRDGLSRVLPSHILSSLAQMPNGIYDGELLVPGSRSYGVTELTKSSKLVYTVFDVLQLFNDTTIDVTYDHRRALLTEMFRRDELLQLKDAVRLSKVTLVDSMDEIRAICEDVWSHDGEGVIVKARTGVYHPGKRPKHGWLKIKQLQSAVLEVIGFLASRGTKVDRGPYAMAVLQDEEGNTTQVKTRNDAECRRLEEAAIPGQLHPWIGRKLRVDYQERTPDGSYRHIRWDRWDDE